MGAGTLAVAKKRRTEDEAGGEKASRKSPDPSPRQMLVAIKGRPEWYEWLKRAAAFDRSTVVEFLDRAAARYARDIGFDEVPPER